MAIENSVKSHTVAAGEDLSTRQYHVINISGTLAANGNEAAGVLMNKPSQAGLGAQVGVHGVMKGKAGAAIAAGAPVRVTTSGWLITATSGQPVSGKNFKRAAVSSGETFSFLGDFANGRVAT